MEKRKSKLIIGQSISIFLYKKKRNWILKIIKDLADKLIWCVINNWWMEDVFNWKLYLYHPKQTSSNQTLATGARKGKWEHTHTSNGDGKREKNLFFIFSTEQKKSFRNESFNVAEKIQYHVRQLLQHTVHWTNWYFM